MSEVEFELRFTLSIYKMTDYLINCTVWRLWVQVSDTQKHVISAITFGKDVSYQECTTDKRTFKNSATEI